MMRYYYPQYRAGVRAPEPGPPPPPSPDEPCGPDMMWDPVTQSCMPILPWPIQQSSVSHRAGGLTDVTPWGLALPPLGAYQFFGGRGGKDSGWSSTFVLAAIVGAGVFGYFIYRNLVVTKAGFRGAGRAFGMGD